MGIELSHHGVGLPRWSDCGPDAECGESVVAFVMAAEGVAPPSEADLDQTCLDHIARFERPEEYRFVDSLPTNNYGKVVKRELRDRLQAEVE